MAQWNNMSVPSKVDGMAFIATLTQAGTFKINLNPAKSGNGWMLSWTESDKSVCFVSDTPFERKDTTPSAPTHSVNEAVSVLSDEEPC